MRERVLQALVAVAIRHRRLVYITSALLTLGALATAARLKLDMRWSTLLPHSLPVVQEYDKIDANFLQPGNMIIAISGPDRVELEHLTDEVTALLDRELVCAPEVDATKCKAEQRYARFVYGKLPEAWLTEHALRLAKPQDARRFADLLADPRLVPYLTHVNDDLEAEFADAEAVANQEREMVGSLDALESLVRGLAAAAGGRVDEASVARIVRDLTIGQPYLFSLDNQMSLVMVASAVAFDDFETTPLLDKKIEALLAPLAAQHPGYRIERTGMVAIGRDEMDSVGPITQLITLLALVLIFALLVWNFRSVMTPVLSLVPIVLGIAWAMGIIAVTLGTLNLITVMIMVVLLGLGIDFTIHLCNRFGEEVAGGAGLETALERTIARTGAGVLTGALTTAAAFFALCFADTKGIREFGITAGIGVLATLAAALWVLPPLLADATQRRLRRGKPPKPALDFSPFGRLAVRMGRAPVPVILVALAITATGIWAGTKLGWEWNFMELEAKGLRSVELQDEIIDKYKLSVSLSLLTAKTVEESRALRQELKQNRLVGDVDDVSLWLSRPDLPEAAPHIARLREALSEDHPPMALAGSSEAVPANREELVAELDRLWANLVEIQALSITGGQDRVVEKTQRLVATRARRAQGLLKTISARLAGAGVAWPAVQHFSHSFARLLAEQARTMAAGTEPVTLEILPPDIRARYVSKTADGFLMRFYPKHNLYERDALEAFQASVSRVHQAITGTPQMILFMSLETMREGKLAVLISLAVILLLLLVDFRRPLVALVTFLPLLGGLSITFLVMWLMGEKLNYVNMIGLPVIIGIGVDDGVHFFHRFLQEGRGGLARAATSVGRAMLMTTLTTMIGFGSLMLYLMRGMASMGLVLFIGVGACFVVTVTVLPALASLLENRFIPKSEEVQR